MASDLIDFKELVSAKPGEGLETLVRFLGKNLNLSPSWSGRGPDGGRDLMFTEILSGALCNERVKWVVSCKDFAKSGKSVAETDLPSVTDKLAQYEATGFLLVTTTTVGVAAKALLDSLDKKNGGAFHTLVWDSGELTQQMLDSANEDLLRQFFPNSYHVVKSLNSLEAAILPFKDQVPDEVFDHLMHLVKPYATPELRGPTIWPYDLQTADTIDKIVVQLVINNDVLEALAVTQNINADAFVKFVDKISETHPALCQDYLLAVATKHEDLSLGFNAAQMLFDSYEIDNSDKIDIYTTWDDETLTENLMGEIYSFLNSEIPERPDLDVHDSLDEIPGYAEVDFVSVHDMQIESLPEERKVCFSGKMYVDIIPLIDGREEPLISFPGTFEGYIDEHGMYLENADIDTKSYFGYNDHLTIPMDF